MTMSAASPRERTLPSPRSSRRNEAICHVSSVKFRNNWAKSMRQKSRTPSVTTRCVAWTTSHCWRTGDYGSVVRYEQNAEQRKPRRRRLPKPLSQPSRHSPIRPRAHSGLQERRGLPRTQDHGHRVNRAVLLLVLPIVLCPTVRRTTQLQPSSSQTWSHSPLDRLHDLRSNRRRSESRSSSGQTLWQDICFSVAFD